MVEYGLSTLMGRGLMKTVMNSNALCGSSLVNRSLVGGGEEGFVESWFSTQSQWDYAETEAEIGMRCRPFPSAALGPQEMPR